MRRAVLILVAVAYLATAAVASATTQTASSGGVTATLSYSGGPGITTRNERLTISQAGKVQYNQPVPAKGCFKVCSPEPKKSVHVVDLYGDGEQEVVVDLFSGGADCCFLEQVYVPSAAVRSWVLTSRNFGNAGAVLQNIGPNGQPEFVSADNAFYCTFTGCAASGQPLQILSFTGDAFHVVTTQHPRLIATDASRWLKLYYRNLSEGRGLISAWAADEDNLGLEATVATVLQRQVADGHLTGGFVAQLQRFLVKHHYAS